MKKLISTLSLLALISSGCTHMRAVTSETNKDGLTKKTEITATSFFDAHNAMTKTSAKLNEKTSGISIGGLDQDTSGTNTVSLFEKGMEGLGTGLAKGAKTL